MADTQNINAVTALQSIDANDSILVSDGNTSLAKIDYNKLAKSIIEQYTGSTLAGSGQSIQSAFNALNSNPYTTLHRYPATGWSETADLVTEIQRYWTSFPNIKLYACVLALNNVGEVSLLVYRNGNYGTVIANCFAWGESVVLKNMNGTWSKYDVQAEINTLNSKTNVYSFGTVSSLSAFVSALNTYVASMEIGTTKDVGVDINFSEAPFTTARHIGTLYKTSSVRAQITLHKHNQQVIIHGIQDETSWNWEVLAFKSEVDALNAKTDIKEAVVTFISGAGEISVPGMTSNSNAIVNVKRVTGADVNYRVYPQPTTNKLVLYARDKNDAPPADNTQLTINYLCD